MSSNQTYHTWVARILQWRPNERITRVHNMAHLLTGICGTIFSRTKISAISRTN